MCIKKIVNISSMYSLSFIKSVILIHMATVYQMLYWRNPVFETLVISINICIICILTMSYYMIVLNRRE